MIPALVHPAVAAINGERRVRPLPLGHVERALDRKYEGAKATMLETAAYQAFEKSVSGPDGWSDPAEPIALTQASDGQWWLVSGLEILLAARRVGLARVDVLFLKPTEVAGWQVALNRAAQASLSEPTSDEDDLYLQVAGHYA